MERTTQRGEDLGPTGTGECQRTGTAGTRPQPLPQLVVAYAADSARVGERGVLRGIPVTLGRAASSPLFPRGPLDDHLLSRSHAEMEPGSDGSYTVRDLGSRNGTFLNGGPVGAAPVPLRDGDLVRVGLTILVFRVEALPRPCEAAHGIDGISAKAAAVRESVALHGPGVESVLILGESGTGKEVAAKALHASSGRTGPFVALDCPNIAATLWEAELFGHEKGAFTGAHAARAGKLEAADRGTILLDEVGEMPLESQAKLLRVLETREVIRVGGTRPIPLDLRFLAATNRDLAQAAGQGRFRLDLYARLAHAVIRIPPLRERVEDVPSLLRRFLDSAGLSGLRLAVEDVERLMRHSWPLNVREMATLAPFFAAQAGGDSAALSLTAPILQRLEEYAHLTSSPVGGGAPAAGPPPPQPGMQRQVPPAEPAAPPAALEASTLRSLLAKHSGNVTEVAAELRLHRFQLYRLLRRHGLDPEEFR